MRGLILLVDDNPINLKLASEVLMAGGYSTVTAVDGDTIVLRVKPDNLKLQFARSAVSTLVPPEGSKT